MSTDNLKASLSTDTGCVREHNEDFVASHEPERPEDVSKDGRLYIVADGVGGSDFGEVASQYATEQTVYHYLDTSDMADWRQRLVQAMEAANGDLRHLIAEKESGSRMATTMVAAVIHGEWATIANVGDSRGYHWRNGQLEQITEDHSLVARLVQEGAITQEEAEHHPRRNVILHSLGSENRPRIDVFDVKMAVGDRLILCSDGLTRHIGDDEIAEIAGAGDPAAATENLVELAKERGGEDNISVGIILYQRELVDSDLDAEAEVWNKPDTMTQAVPGATHRGLWIYTAVLCVVQTLLIIWTWIIVNN